jgi:hypothetical protein
MNIIEVKAELKAQQTLTTALTLWLHSFAVGAALIKPLTVQ